MTTHYLDFTPKGAGVVYELYGRIVSCVHLNNSKDCNLAVNWPHWSSSTGQFGSILRVFGKPEELLRLVKQLAGLIDSKLIDCGELASVPADAPVSDWMFVRDRQASHSSPSYARRIARRAAAREEAIPTCSLGAKALTVTHWLPMQSVSTQQSYRMDIMRVPAVSDSKPSVFGLSVALPRF
jgi:CRISPR-associated endoribonuclease Cas6/Csy4 subtype I-F